MFRIPGGERLLTHAIVFASLAVAPDRELTRMPAQTPSNAARTPRERCQNASECARMLMNDCKSKFSRDFDDRQLDRRMIANSTQKHNKPYHEIALAGLGVCDAGLSVDAQIHNWVRFLCNL